MCRSTIQNQTIKAKETNEEREERCSKGETVRPMLCTYIIHTYSYTNTQNNACISISSSAVIHN